MGFVIIAWRIRIVRYIPDSEFKVFLQPSAMNDKHTIKTDKFLSRKIFHYISIFMYINITLTKSRSMIFFYHQCFVVSMQMSKNFHSLLHESKTNSKYMKNINSKKTYNVFLSALCTFLCSLVLQFATQGKWAGGNPINIHARSLGAVRKLKTSVDRRLISIITDNTNFWFCEFHF